MARPTVVTYVQPFAGTNSPSVTGVSVAAGDVIEAYILRPARSITSVTWDATGANQPLVLRGNGGSNRASLYEHLTPTAGANRTVSVVLSGSTAGYLIVNVISGVDAASPHGGLAVHTAASSGTDLPAQNVASGDATDYVVTDGLAIALQTIPVADASQTAQAGMSSATGPTGANGSRKNSTGATTTMDWSWTGVSAAYGYVANQWKGAAGTTSVSNTQSIGISTTSAVSVSSASPVAWTADLAQSTLVPAESVAGVGTSQATAAAATASVDAARAVPVAAVAGAGAGASVPVASTAGVDRGATVPVAAVSRALATSGAGVAWSAPASGSAATHAASTAGVSRADAVPVATAAGVAGSAPVLYEVLGIPRAANEQPTGIATTAPVSASRVVHAALLADRARVNATALAVIAGASASAGVGVESLLRVQREAMAALTLIGTVAQSHVIPFATLAPFVPDVHPRHLFLDGGRARTVQAGVLPRYVDGGRTRVVR